MFGSYICEECGDEQIVRKKYGEEWPEFVECPFCKTFTSKKLLGKNVSTKTPTGRLGNAANNYTSIGNKDVTSKQAWSK